MRNAVTREKLLQAGHDAMHQFGFVGTGVQEIIEAARVPKGSFYNHFRSKEAFGVEVADRYFATHSAEALKILTSDTPSPIERLREYFRYLRMMFAGQDFERSCLLGNFALEMSERSAAIRERLTTHFRSWSSALETCIQQAQAAGEIRRDGDPAALAEFALNSWEGALLRMRADKSTRSMQLFERYFFDDILGAGR